jgi:hypothetical protein
MDFNAPAPWWLVPLALVLVAIRVGLPLGWEWWLDRRAQRHWERGEPARQRRWAEEDRQQALRQQLREMEEVIREEQLSDTERAWRQQYQEREAAIRREARRRLGLPEEEP